MPYTFLLTFFHNFRGLNLFHKLGSNCLRPLWALIGDVYMPSFVKRLGTYQKKRVHFWVMSGLLSSEFCEVCG